MDSNNHNDEYCTPTLHESSSCDFSCDIIYSLVGQKRIAPDHFRPSDKKSVPYFAPLIPKPKSFHAPKPIRLSRTSQNKSSKSHDNSKAKVSIAKSEKSDAADKSGITEKTGDSTAVKTDEEPGDKTSEEISGEPKG